MVGVKLKKNYRELTQLSEITKNKKTKCQKKDKKI
jgi:hypothetical protein